LMRPLPPLVRNSIGASIEKLPPDEQERPVPDHGDS
jgi:hypothetical protein